MGAAELSCVYKEFGEAEVTVCVRETIDVVSVVASF